MTNYKTMGLVLLTALLLACGSDTPPKPSGKSLSNGSWSMHMNIGEETILLRWDIKDGAATLVNGEERINVPDLSINGDSISLKMPRYDSEFIGTLTSNNQFEGEWINYQKDNYSLPFVAEHTSEAAWEYKAAENSSRKYDIRFSPDTEDEYPAIGVFTGDNGLATGTFLTETGDYRYLQGTIDNNEMTLSCFDGAHMFLFKASIAGDSLNNGSFYSGKHWSEPWEGVRNELATLTHPDSLTYLLPEYSTLEFEVNNTAGEPSLFNKDFFQDKITIVQIFGTWCPNCYDENIFYKELYADYNDRGLQIIPVAFERTDDFDNHVKAVNEQFQELQMPYQAYIGGKASKKLAGELFHQVNDIISFPTSFFIDRSGTVRRIHTGFYGPGTGRYYTDYTENTRHYIEQLLEEDLVAAR
jgi:thiol-disulfide isomerase/thioredoxin